ncbi:hybrid sensor histidine kinase/response regulator [Pseudooceanicola sp. HF7]|uniref:ATP-binding response regulator n=1 Tax=Pseudooceanicola sp. HF7 TaxID=2721560 RepID=UPI001431CB5A|nr:hybrid sensor histidine kinase/response regulator [Pseudooceanicola sp. HF7]NIZ09421.1 response regulator [Pseudooceanicola sp. HF7]
MIDRSEDADIQVARQAKIIDALVRRATRQNEVGTTAYSAFQSAIELQAQVAAKTRDLERAATELESVRFERERTRRNLDEALSAMGDGLALFTDKRLDICNDLFQHLLVDVSDRVVPGLGLVEYFDLLAQSEQVLSVDSRVTPHDILAPTLSLVIELTRDRWYRLNMERTSAGTRILLLTEITSLVRQNRVEKERLIDRQADYLQAVFANMTSGVCTFSSTGEVMMHNLQFRQLLGLPYAAVQKGMTLHRLLMLLTHRGLIADTSLEMVEKWQARLLRAGRFRRRVRSGTDRVFDLQANMLPDGGFLVELKDVTLEARATEMLENRVQERTAELTRTNQRLTEQYEEKARVEEELRLAKERAEAAVSSKTRFLAAASHDLLQPINAAKLLIATLQKNTAGTAHGQMTERLKGAFTSIEHLLHALLDISRLDSNDHDAVSPSTLHLGNILQGVFEDQMPLAEERRVTLRMVPCDCHVRSDPVYLLRSIQNLVVNAIQYTEPGGKVLFGCRRRGDKVEFQVWDTGIGIGEEDKTRIFEEFARAGNVPVGSGVGLGLSIVERTCRHLGHRLWVSSELGVGSVFRIEMARVETAGEPRSSAPSHPASDVPLEHIALVVENDEDVLFATTQTLQSWGASVLPAASTEEALRFVRDMGMPPDIMLVDYQLDGGDTGLHAIEAIRRETGINVPAIMITADRRESLLRAGESMDFTVMTKPVQLSRLRPLIEWKVQGQPGPVQPKVAHDMGLQGHTLS